jgi:hypothetical protein
VSPLIGGVLASHEFASQAAGAIVPAVHPVVPLTVYPELQVGWQVSPDASVAVQSPKAPLVGGVLASHGLPSQESPDSVFVNPSSQLAQILSPLFVQAGPTAATPLGQVHVLTSHLKNSGLKAPPLHVSVAGEAV